MTRQGLFIVILVVISCVAFRYLYDGFYGFAGNKLVRVRGPVGSALDLFQELSPDFPPPPESGFWHRGYNTTSYGPLFAAEPGGERKKAEAHVQEEMRLAHLEGVAYLIRWQMPTHPVGYTFVTIFVYEGLNDQGFVWRRASDVLWMSGPMEGRVPVGIWWEEVRPGHVVLYNARPRPASPPEMPIPEPPGEEFVDVQPPLKATQPS